MPFVFRSLVARLLFFLVLLSGGTAVLIGLTTYDRSRATLETQLRIELERQGAQLELQIAQFVDHALQDLVFIQRSPGFEPLTHGLLRQAAGSAGFRRAHADLSQYLAGIVARNPSYREILILSRRGGEVLVATEPAHEGSYRARDPVFLRSLEGTFLQKVYPWPVSGEPTLSVATPLTGPEGFTIGVLILHLNLDYLEQVIGARRAQDDPTRVYLVDSLNSFVSHSRSAPGDYSRGAHSPGIDRALQGQNGSGAYPDYRGVPVVGHYRWLTELGVALLVEIPEEMAFAPARALGRDMLLLGLGSVLLVALVTWFLAKRLARPVIRVAAAAQRVADGDLRLQVPVETGDETGQLADSFNRMTIKLERLYHDIQESEERYREIFNATSEAIFIHDADSGRILDVNDAAARMYGRPRDQLLETPVAELSATDGPHRQSEALHKIALASREGPQLFEWKARRGNGEFWVEVALQATTIRGERRVLAVVRDIDQRKQAERALAETTARLQLLLERMPIACIVWDPHFRVQLWNPAAETIFGYSLQEALATHPFETIVPPEAQPHVEQIWGRLMDGDATAHSINTNLRKGGGTITCEWFNTPLRDREGKPIGAISMVQDITERLAAENSLRESEARFRMLVENAADPLYLHDPEGTLLDVNQRACDTLGYTREELLTLNIHDLETGQSQTHLAEIHRNLKRGEAITLEGLHRRKDGSVLPVEVRLFRFTTGQGEDRLLAQARDISERKAAEAELQHYREHLEHLVEERTRELQEAQDALVQQERLAILGQLTATVSHELRNPLGTIANAAFLIENQLAAGDTAQTAGSLALLQRNIERCDRIISELLDFTRQRPVALEMIQLEAWLTALLEEYPLAEGITLETDFTANAAVPMDVEAFRRVLINLLDNACQAMEEPGAGGKRLRIATRTDGDQVILDLADEGPGIPEKLREKVFEPLFSTKSFGVGLGMSIVRKIVSDHGAAIEIGEAPEGGALIRLRLPRTASSRNPGENLCENDTV